MSEKIQIGGRSVGQNEPAFVIAEAGSNHNRNWHQAKRLIEAAAEAGADAVKFQLYRAEDLYPRDSLVYEAVRATELPVEWLPDLSEHSHKCGLMFFASVFTNEAVDRLAEIGVPAYKIASSDTTNLPLLKYTASKGKPVILSTGMCDLADIHEAVEVIRSEGNTDIVLLQCTALYPAAPEHVHLRTMDTLRSAFQLPVGFSDHTMDLVIPAVAVGRGACVIEKHLTLGRQFEGPDHSYALEPAEFRKMVDGVRVVEKALGSPVKMMLAEEAKLARRSSIRARREIQAGEVLTEDLLVCQRPADGVRPRYLNAFVGRRARVRIGEGETITWEKV